MNHLLFKPFNGNIYIDGDFLEKYLDLILRLKAVIAGGEFPSFKNIFKYIDYITLIIFVLFLIFFYIIFYMI